MATLRCEFLCRLSSEIKKAAMSDNRVIFVSCKNQCPCCQTERLFVFQFCLRMLCANEMRDPQTCHGCDIMQSSLTKSVTNN